MLSNATVVRTVQRGRPAGRRFRDQAQQPAPSCRVSAEDRRSHVAEVAREAAVTGAKQTCGVLAELKRSFLGSKEQHQWVVLDPTSATLSMWDRRPEDAAPQGSFFSSNRVSKRVYLLEQMEELDSNRAFRNIFLRFEGGNGTLVLTAPDDGDFDRWMDALAKYSTAHV